MKILIISTAYWPHIGGAEIAVREITKRLENVSFDMITIKLHRRDLDEEKIGHINVYRLGYGWNKLDKLLFPLRASRFAAKLHDKNKYNIVWSIMASYAGFAALFFKKKHPDVKFLLTLQEGDNLQVIEKKISLINFWFRQIFTSADAIQCISKHLAEWAKHMGAKAPIRVIPNGVQPNTANKEVISGIRKNLNIKSEAKIILSTSRLVPKNGIQDLINAVHILVSRDSLPVLLIVCGIGKQEGQLKSLVKILKIDRYVKFVGFIEPKDLPAYYEVADVFCRPSLSEGLGNSFLESMAYGVPVVAPLVGGIKDFLQDHITGFVCHSANPTDIADKIKYVLDKKNTDLVTSVIDNAKQLVDKNYNWNTVALQMKDVFNQLYA